MAKKTASPKTHRKKKLPPITGISRQIVDHLINAAVFGEYPDCCDLEALAKHFDRQPNRLRTTINRLVEAGYLEVPGELLEIAYPTVAALRKQDPQISEAAARQIVRGLKSKR